MFEWSQVQRFNTDIEIPIKIHPQLLALKDYFTNIKN